MWLHIMLSHIKGNVSPKAPRKRQIWRHKALFVCLLPFIVSTGIACNDTRPFIIMVDHTIILRELISAFHGYFEIEKHYQSRLRSFAIYSQMKDWIYSCMIKAHITSRCQSNFDVVHTTTNGSFCAFLSVEHTWYVFGRIILLIANAWKQFYGKCEYLWKNVVDLPFEQLRCGSFSLLLQYTWS